MYDLQIKVKDKEITAENEVKFIQGSYNIDRLTFDFSEAWNDLDKTAVFIVDGTTTYNVAVVTTTDECYCLVPSEVYAGSYVSIGVFGTTTNSTTSELEKVLVTNLIKKTIYIGSYVETPDNLPTQTEWNLYIAEFNKILDSMNLDVEAVSAIKTDVERLKAETQAIEDDTKTLASDLDTKIASAETTISGYVTQGNEILESTKDVEEATQKIADDFVTTASTKTSEFNANASEKTSTYNSNASTKLNEYNANATSKTSEYNTNASEKTSEFDENASAKTSAFNTNASTLTTNFNSNVTSKTNTFNENATSKTSTFNTNAEEKTTAFNENYDTKKAEIDSDLNVQKIEDNTENITRVSNEVEHIKSDILEPGTDTGTFIHREDCAMTEYTALSVDGVCQQDTTSGYNIAPISDSRYVLDDNNIITISGYNDMGIKYTEFNISSGETIYLYFIKYSTTSTSVSLSFYANNTTYDEYGFINIQKLKTNILYKVKYTATEDTTIMYKLWGNIGAVTKFQLWATKDESKTTFEPYTGGQPSPSPDYPQEISTIEDSLVVTSCNKNFYGSAIKTSSTLSSNYEIITDTSDKLEIQGKEKYYSGVYKKYILHPSTKYIISLRYSEKTDGTNSRIYVKYGNECENIAVNNCDTQKAIADTTTSLEFTTDSTGLVAIMFTCNWTANDGYIVYNDILLEDNSTATNYEAYISSQINANLGDNFIGKINDTYKDTLAVEYNEEDAQYHLVLHKRVYKNTSYNGETYDYCISETARKDGTIDCGSLVTGQVVYYSGDETEVDLGTCEMPITYSTITNLFTDSTLLPTITANYYRTFLLTIQNLEVNNKSLKAELVDLESRVKALEEATPTTASEVEEEA